MGRSGRLVAAAMVLGLVGVAVATSAAPRKERVPKRLVLDDFESPPGGRSYGILDTTLPKSARGAVQWSREACRPAGAEGHCMRVEYAFDSPHPAQVSFRIDLGDLDISAYDHVELWLKGDPEPGFSPDLKIGFRHPKPGSDRLVEDGSTVVTGVSREWQRIVVPLNRLSGIREWKHVRSFFLALESRRAGAARHGAYWIDDVAALALGGPRPTVGDGVVPRKKEAWKKAVGGPLAASWLVQRRLSGWPARLLAPRGTLPAGDRELLERIARDTWTGIAALTDRENGLPVDHVSLSQSLAPPDSRIGDYTNITNVGMHLIAVAAARELGIVAEEQAVEHLRKVLDTLDRLDSHQGFFFNYYDTTSLERTSNFISFVDSSWLTSGLVVVRNTFPALAERASRIIDRQSYAFFYDDVAQQMSHGYYVNVPTRSEYHYGALYTEARLGSLLAIGKGDAPEDHWFAMSRTYPPEADWQSQPPKGWKVRKVGEQSVEGGYYEWKGHRYIPSWGGSMFEALMPVLVLDEQRYAPKSLGANGIAHAAVQRQYATEELGYPVWGLSPAVRPSGGYGEYGVKVLGTLGYGPGAVAPYAAALALAVDPERATADLRRLVERYDVYGEYGFYDAVDPTTGEVAHEYLALDQSMVLIAIANHLKDHCIQKRFAADPIVQRVLPLIGAEDFFD